MPAFELRAERENFFLATIAVSLSEKPERITRSWPDFWMDTGCVDFLLWFFCLTISRTISCS